MAASRRSDCEDRLRSLMVLGCGWWSRAWPPEWLAFVPCCDLSARGCRPRPGGRSWP